MARITGRAKTIFSAGLIGWILGIVGAGLWHWHTAYLACLILFSTLIFIYFTLSLTLDQMRANNNVQLLASTLAVVWAIGMMVASICKSIDASDICRFKWHGHDYCAQAAISVVFTWCSFAAWLLCGVLGLRYASGK